MDLKTEQKLLSDLAVIKSVVEEIRKTFWEDHDELQSLKTIKEDMDKKISEHVVTNRWIFGILFIMLVGALWKAI